MLEKNVGEVSELDTDSPWICILANSKYEEYEKVRV